MSNEYGLQTELFLTNGKSLAEASLEELERQLIEESSFEWTMPMKEVFDQWLLLVEVHGPWRLNSDFSRDGDGRSNVVVIYVLRQLDDNLDGILEKIPVWQSSNSDGSAYAKVSSVTLRTFLEKGGEIGVKFRKIATKGGQSFIATEFKSKNEVRGLV